MFQYYIKFYLLNLKIRLQKFGFFKLHGPDNYLIKWKRIQKFCYQFNGNLDFVETGTYYGLTVNRFKNKMKTLYSIELDNSLYYLNQRRFEKYSNINLIKGDSAVELPILLDNKTLNYNCLFWLDGHYSSKETAIAEKVSPILDELNSIFTRFDRLRNHWIILIDDLRLFDGLEYPSLSQIKNIANQFNFHVTLDSDCIVLNSK